MARSRTISPKFFQNEDLAELPPEARLLFIGLWTIADRSGRLEDRPKRIRGQLFSYGVSIDLDELLAGLDSKDLIFRYRLNGYDYIQIPKWFTYQRPHPKEPDSGIPPIPCDLVDYKACRTFCMTSREKVSTSRSSSLLSVPSDPSVPPIVPRAAKPARMSVVQSGWRDVAFREFWNHCAWAKIARGAAHRAYCRRAATPELAEQINKAAREQGPRLLKEAAQQGRSVLHPATWLNGERWADEGVPEQPGFDLSPFDAKVLAEMEELSSARK